MLTARTTLKVGIVLPDTDVDDTVRIGVWYAAFGQP